jgi:predicted dehydrogenase
MKRGTPIGVAMVGIGSWAEVIADAVRRSEKMRLMTCFSRTPEKRMAFSRKFGCGQEKCYEDLLKRDDIDGVFLITPNAVHAEQTELAAKYGKHVFVDKPIANTLADGEKMIKTCREAGVVLMIGHNMRRLAGFRKIKELIDDGVIGQPVMVEANFSHNLGFELTAEKWRWRGDDSGCPAGSLMTMGVHHADTLIQFFGPVNTVFSQFSRLYIQAPVEDTTMTLFRFQSGTLGYLGSNYCSPKTNFIHVYGTKANLMCSVTMPNVPFAEYLKMWPSADRYTQLVISDLKDMGEKEIPLLVGDTILEEVDEFADCIRMGAKPETDGPSALAALTLIRAAIESAQTGQQVLLKTKEDEQ